MGEHGFEFPKVRIPEIREKLQVVRDYMLKMGDPALGIDRKGGEVHVNP